MNTSDDIWKLISAGDLYSADELDALQSEYIRTPPGQFDVLQWLMKQEQITEYHAQVFRAGHSGPFRYSDYVVQDRIESGLFEGGFEAVHSETRYPVILQFITDEDAVDRWSWLESNIRNNNIAASPFLFRCFQAVDTGEFKFFVFEKSTVTTLGAFLKKQGQIKQNIACDIIRRIARATQSLHQIGAVHGHISASNVHIAKGNHIKLFQDPQFQFIPLAKLHQEQKDEDSWRDRVDYAAPELAIPGSQPDEVTDIYSLGCLLYQMLSGKPPFPLGDIRERMHQHATQKVKPLENLGYDKNLAQFVYFMMAKDRHLRFQSIPDVLDQLDSIPNSGDSKPKPPPTPDSFAAFDRFIRGRLLPGNVDASNNKTPSELMPPGVSKPAPQAEARQAPAPTPTPAATVAPSAVPVPTPTVPVATAQAPATAPVTQPSAGLNLMVSEEDTSSTSSYRSRQKKSLKKTLIPLGVTILLLAIPLIFLWSKYGDKLFSTANGDSDPAEKKEDDPEKTDEGKTDGDGKNGKQNTSTTQSNLIADDNRTLWEGPTDGNPIELEMVPAGMRLLLSIRGAELFKNDTESLIVKSLGPDFKNQTDAAEKAIGISWKEAERLQFGIHDNIQEGQDNLLGSFVVNPVDKKPLTYWLAKWGDCNKVTDLTKPYYRSDNGWSYFTEDNDAEIKQFLVAPESLIKDLIENGGAITPTGVNQLIRETDSDRQINLIVIPADLNSPSGQTLFSGHWSGVLGLMNWFHGGDSVIQASCLSIHFDNGDVYVESILNPKLGKDPFTLADELRRRIASSYDVVDNYMLDIDADRHWKKVAREIPRWIQNLSKMARVGVENRLTVANSWQDAPAIHNLLAGLEYTLAFSNGSSSSTTSTKPARKIPQTIEELLLDVRTIEIANDDLNVAVDKIVTEIKDDYPSLPFDFKIEIQGTHLMDDGITKNQRLVDFQVEKKPLGDILAQFVFTANPIKTAAGPSDPDCKLIWVLMNPDPAAPTKKQVLITTRKAAAREGYTLPKQFVPQ